MRRARRNHGTLRRTVLRGGGRVASSASVIRLCLLGSSRKKPYQATTQTRLARPSTTKEPRQVTSAASAAISGGVTALPKREKEWVMPWAKPNRASGIQLVIARVAVGKAAPSPKPRASRAASSAANPPAAPVSTVAAQTTRPQIPRVRRAPKRLPSQPPTSWNSAQGMAKGENNKASALVL